MSRTVDVYLTPEELADGARKTACLKVDRALMAPTRCVSKQGLGTAKMFASQEPRPQGRHLTDTEMGMLYDKFVGPNSLGNAAVRLEQAEQQQAQVGPARTSSGVGPRTQALDSGDRAPAALSPGMAVVMAAANAYARAPHLDETFAERAASTATMKYIAPHIARKYGVKQTIQPPQPVSQRQRPASASPALGGGARGPAAVVLAAAAAGRQHPRVSTSDAEVGAGGSARPPRPGSAAFSGPSREQAQRTGSHFIYGGRADIPAVGKYAPKYSALDKAAHLVPCMEKMARERLAQPSHATTPLQQEHRRASASHQLAEGGGESIAGGVGSSAAVRNQQQKQRPGSAPAAGRRPVSAAAEKDAQGSAARAAADKATAKAEAKAAAQALAAARHAELFSGAHRVHERKPPVDPNASQAFKTASRRPPSNATTAGHLFGEYWRDGYDSLARKSSRPASAFARQVPRPPPTELAAHGDTSPALGPGTYPPSDGPPPTRTGRHVTSGHSPLAQVHDWSKDVRGHVRPVSAGAFHQGYWGPDGPHSAMFPDDPQYADLVALRALQERTQQREGAPTRQVAASAAAAGQDGGGIAGDCTAEGERPLTYIDPETYGKFSSTGLAKRVQGGAFSTSTRGIMAYAMRVMSDNKVIPPATVAVRTATDLTYDYDYTKESHRARAPSWNLPPNRNELSQRWVQTAATAYL